MYLQETGRSPLLTAEQEKLLGSQIEKAKHLKSVISEWSERYQRPPATRDIVLALLERMCQSSAMFDAVCSALVLAQAYHHGGESETSALVSQPQ